jgi:hypothetical protein
MYQSENLYKLIIQASKRCISYIFQQLNNVEDQQEVEDYFNLIE